MTPDRCPTCGSENRGLRHAIGQDPTWVACENPWHDTPAPADPPCTCKTSDRCAQHTVAGREAWAHGVLTATPPTGDRECPGTGPTCRLDPPCAWHDRGERPEDVLRRFIKGDVMTSRYKVRAALDALVADRRQAKEATAMIAEVAASLDRALAAERVRGDRLAEALTVIADSDYCANPVGADAVECGLCDSCVARAALRATEGGTDG